MRLWARKDCSSKKREKGGRKKKKTLKLCSKLNGNPIVMDNIQSSAKIEISMIVSQRDSRSSSSVINNSVTLDNNRNRLETIKLSTQIEMKIQ
jgi:hypothetical protein